MTLALPAVPPLPKRRWGGYLVGGAGVLLLVTGAVGAYEWHRMHTLPPLVDVLPAKYTDPPAGPKAPTTSALGFAVGRTTLADAQARLTSLGISCRDTSPRALSEISRQNKRIEMQRAEEKKAKGEPVAAVTGASVLWHRSKMESNPQVRLSCEEVDFTRLDGRVNRPRYAGRLLLIWDSASLPLRYASAQQSLPTFAEAAAGFDAASKALEAQLNKPGEGRLLSDFKESDFPGYANTRRTWTYSDFAARVTAQNLGHRGIEINEIYEVPFPIRSDAPTLPPTAASPDSGATPSQVPSP